ncbi:hypothetical protein Pan44_14060 [Caulifigura coniformis]|uniref:Uncharacterized protein n=1 Tax=Caulifigura coniformis TaxID=2527983 RepID=A0A517SB97_9PLAN|nr:hypothetical protein [Caulifigura coniformis]QDT53389.1 hypothetical protein Pan44_14060 [Caulifigura coniformis]
MQRTVLVGAAAGFLLALIVLVTTVTTTYRRPTCPHCGRPLNVRSTSISTHFWCNPCTYFRAGPPTPAISWADAAEYYLSPDDWSCDALGSPAPLDRGL